MTLEIRADIRAQYSSLFGKKTVNGRVLVVEDVIAGLTHAVAGELPVLLAQRHAFQQAVARGEARYDFLAGDTHVSDADGHTTQATIAHATKAAPARAASRRRPTTHR